MNCAYLDCNDAKVGPGVASCPTCKRLLKPCGVCGAAGRAFANFCPACGEALPATPYDWPTFKGGARRFGLNEKRLGHTSRELETKEILSLKLDQRCHALLSWDRHLIAIATDGRIKVADPVSGRGVVATLTADGPVTCEPCIDGGVLYLPVAGRVIAYSLGALTLAVPKNEARWQARIDGTPVQALLAINNRLFLNVAQNGGSRTIQMLDGIDRLTGPSPPRVLFTAGKLSALAAEPQTGQVLFLSENQGALAVHNVDTSADQLTVVSRRVPNPLLPLVESVPIVVMGTKLFGVFGHDDQLCRLDLEGSLTSTAIREDAKRISFNRFGEWVQVESTCIAFPHLRVTDDLSFMDRVQGQPVLLRDCATAIGLQDGRILLYDFKHPPYRDTLRLSSEGSEITALASFDRFLAAGDARGRVKVYELLPKEH